MIKIIHTSDLHLEKSLDYASYPKKFAEERREENWMTFNKLLTKNPCDFVLISGDLFEAEYFNRGDFFKLRNIIENNMDKKLVICPGNHDSSEFYSNLQEIDNLFVFTKDHLDYFEFPEFNTRIYGIAWEKNRYDKINIDCKLDKSFINILMLHCDVFQDTGYMYVSLNNLKELDFNYIALGHIHKAQRLSKNIAYSGCLEPLDFGEQGSKGYIELYLDNNFIELNFKPYSSRQFIEKNIQIDQEMDENSILNLIKNSSREKDFERIYLQGLISLDSYNSLEWILKITESSFYYVEFVNNLKISEDISLDINSIPLNYVFDYIDKAKESDEIKSKAKNLLVSMLLRG